MLSRSRTAFGRLLSRPRWPGRSTSTSAASASLELKSPDALQVSFHDGRTAQLHPAWLRERCLSETAVDVSTLQPKMNPHDLPKDLLLEQIKLMQGEDAVQIAYSDGHVSQLSLSQLRAELEGFCDAPIQVPHYNRLRPRLWSGSEQGILPVFQHDDIASSEGQRLALIEELLTVGQALVRGVPQKDGEVVRFGQRLSTLRSTDWGKCFNVRTRPDDAATTAGGVKKDLAYTPKPIGFHTDNPYRFPTPDFQLLHAIEHCSCPEGEAPCTECTVMNFMVDGFYIAERLRQEDPDAFELLCTVPVRFENNGGDGGSALVHVAPHFELDEDPQSRGQLKLRSVRFSAKSGQYAPPLHHAKLGAFYKARRRFSEMLHDGKDTLSLQFAPGDLLIFDNQRLLHARSPIAPTDGERWVQGCYIDRDGLWLNYERWRRNAWQQ